MFFPASGVVCTHDLCSGKLHIDNDQLVRVVACDSCNATVRELGREQYSLEPKLPGDR